MTPRQYSEYQRQADVIEQHAKRNKMKLIKIKENHYVIVDDSEIKEDCWALHMGILGEREIVTANGLCKLDKKITHSTQFLEGVKQLVPSDIPIELIGEVDVEKKAYLTAQKKFKLEHIPLEQIDEYGGVIKEFVQNFIITYNQAIEDNKDKKYTEEDMANAITFGWDLSHYHRLNTEERLLKMQKDYIQSLQPKTEWEVEFDTNGKLKLK